MADAKVNSMVDMGISRDDAIFALKQSNNDVERAIDYMFSGRIEEDRKKMTWDETQFTKANWEDLNESSGTAKVSPQPQISEHEIQAFAPETFYDSTSRPLPNDRPFVREQVVDLSGQDDDEEDDMAKAMRMSLQSLTDSGMDIDSQQETGVLRPSTRQTYDADEWGVVQIGSGGLSPQILENARREPEKIPTLLPCAPAPYLAPYLTVLHSVPLARSALSLFGKQLVEDYGFADRWWDKQQIFVPGFASSEITNQDMHRLSLLVEIQRIMAFLDQTGSSDESQRAWASIENLVRALSSCGDSYVDLVHADFLMDSEPVVLLQRTWEFVTGHYADTLDLSPDLKRLVNTVAPSTNTLDPIGEYLFTSLAVVDSPISLPDDTSTEQKFTTLDVVISSDLRDIYKSLTGHLDSLLWSAEPDVCLKTVAHIFTMTIHQESGMAGTGVELPTTWYPDRYTPAFKDVMKPNVARRTELFGRIEELEKRKKMITEYPGFNTHSLLNATRLYFTPPSESERSSASKNHIKVYEKITKLTASLDSLVDRINRKITALSREIDALSNFMSDPSSVPDDENLKKLEFHRYTLAGVVISDSSFFVKTGVLEKEDDLIDMDEPESSDPTADTPPLCSDKWLHVTYIDDSSSSDGPFIIRQVNVEQVVDTARVEGAVTAIYASDAAYASSSDLPLLNPGLLQFLRRDNEALASELNPDPSSSSSSDEATSNSAEADDEPSDLISFTVGGGAEPSEPAPDYDVAMSDSGTVPLTPQQVQGHRTFPRSVPIGFAEPVKNTGSTAAVKSTEAATAPERRHRGSSSGKVKVQHAENASEGEIGDSDDELLARMAKK
ncbi:hypothetical protein BZA70DRAFT_271513 [Myxozyma melibiosi]|uniref:UBA domain-containing protein n=1 Tax=Myxozyma melibiosi TaxID=54550 RepID=A0ABR1FCD6_9ASCO